MNYAYVRVSTVEQNEARQIEALEKRNIDEWFIEKVSGKDTDRPKLQELLAKVTNGDTIFIHDFSRLARSTADLLKLVEELKDRGVSLVSNKENIDTNTPTGKLMLTMIAAIYEFERTNMLERQKEGIEIAKKNNVYKGSKPKSMDIDKFVSLYNKFIVGDLKKSDFALMMDISRPTLDKRIAEYESMAI